MHLLFSSDAAAKKLRRSSCSCACALQILELDEKQADLSLRAVVAFVVLDVVDVLLQCERLPFPHYSSTGFKLFVGCMFCFEICTPEQRVGEMGGCPNFKTNHIELLAQEIS